MAHPVVQPAGRHTRRSLDWWEAVDPRAAAVELRALVTDPYSVLDRGRVADLVEQIPLTGTQCAFEIWRGAESGQDGVELCGAHDAPNAAAARLVTCTLMGVLSTDKVTLP